MKKELPMPIVIGVIAVLVLIVGAIFFVPRPTPENPRDAGLGMPAKPGGGVSDVDPTQGPGNK
ncbi:MAG: hypothetical protein JST40_13680 [Armatimonadetes bacterium]|nr:hypothetical protein [Armatimonadota bacterium]